MKRFNKKYTLLTILYLGMIFIQSSIPSERIPKMTLLSYDKLIHGGLYFIAAILIYLALREHRPGYSLPIAWMTFGIAVFFGLTDEIHQYFVPGRNASFWDFVADSLGAALGVYLIHRFTLKKARRSHFDRSGAGEGSE